MSRLPDLVLDSRLHTTFSKNTIIHEYPEIDEVGRRYARQEFWEWDKPLGRGGFGQVRLQRCVAIGAEHDSLRAVKSIDKPKNLSNSDLNRELEAIAKFSHDRYRRWFVKSFGWYDDSNSIFIAMEFCHHGDLHHYLKRRRTVSPEEAKQLGHQILEGLVEMHQNDFAHRDLKPGNILIKAMPPQEKWWIVLADFGISKRSDENSGSTTAIKGTTTFMAPELLGYLEHVRPRSITDFMAADMWALGEIIFQMLTGEPVFQHPVDLLRFCSGLLEFPSERLLRFVRDDKGRDFVAGIMELLPKNRMTSSQCMQHGWMQSLVEVEDGAINTSNMEYTGPPIQERTLWDQPVSTQWSHLSSSETTITEPRARLISETALAPSSTDARKFPIHSTFGGIPTESALGPDMNKALPYLINVELKHTLRGSRFSSKGHKAVIRCIAFSPDGRLLATGAADRTVRVWDTRAWDSVHTLKYSPFNKDREVICVAFSPDGKHIVVGSEGAQLWNVRTGQLKNAFRLPETPRVQAVTFSPDSMHLALMHHGGVLMIGNWLTYKDPFYNNQETINPNDEISLSEVRRGEISSVAFSPDSRKIACGCTHNRVQIWDVESGQKLWVLEGDSFLGTIHGIAFSPDGKQLACSPTGEAAQIYDTASWESVHTIANCNSGIIKYSSNGKLLLSPIGTENGDLGIWDVRSGNLKQRHRIHSGSTGCIAISADGKQLASASKNKTVRIWSVNASSPPPPF